MEMVQTRLSALFLSAALLVSCGDAKDISWSKISVDGRITGVTAVEGTEVGRFLGSFADSVYTAPSGRSFAGGTTPAVAKLLIDVQPEMAYLKEIIGWSPVYMPRGGQNREIGVWASTMLKQSVEKFSGTVTDIAIVNSGGIRVDMPDGNVLLDDIVAMFPFHNYSVLVCLKGKDLRKSLELALTSKKFKLVGAERNAYTGELSVNGKPLADNRTYKVASIDFLLDGGDGMYLRDNALKIKSFPVLIKNVATEYVKGRYQQGMDIFGETINRREEK